MTARPPQCHDKVAYPTPAKARRAIEAIRKRSPRQDSGTKPQRSYECPRCKHYHLTSQAD